MTKKYSTKDLINLDITVRETRDLSELEGKASNHYARVAAEEFMRKFNSKSPDFIETTIEYLRDMAVSKRRDKGYQKPTDLANQPHDAETGRFVSMDAESALTDGDEATLRYASNEARDFESQADREEPTPQAMKWTYDYSTGQMKEVPRTTPSIFDRKNYGKGE